MLASLLAKEPSKSGEKKSDQFFKGTQLVRKINRGIFLCEVLQNNSNRKNLRYLSQCHFDHHKSHMD
jgi:hypothetical protein